MYFFKIIFYFFQQLQHGAFCIILYYIHTTLQDSIQHVVWTFDTFKILWIFQNLLFQQSCFWQENVLNISNH